MYIKRDGSLYWPEKKHFGRPILGVMVPQGRCALYISVRRSRAVIRPGTPQAQRLWYTNLTRSVVLTRLRDLDRIIESMSCSHVLNLFWWSTQDIRWRRYWVHYQFVTMFILFIYNFTLFYRLQNSSIHGNQLLNYNMGYKVLIIWHMHLQ